MQLAMVRNGPNWLGKGGGYPPPFFNIIKNVLGWIDMSQEKFLLRNVERYSYKSITLDCWTTELKKNIVFKRHEWFQLLWLRDYNEIKNYLSLYHILQGTAIYLLPLPLFCQKIQRWGVKLLWSPTVFCPMWEELIIRQQEYLLPRTLQFTAFPVAWWAIQSILFIYRLQRMVQNCPSCIQYRPRFFMQDRPFIYCCIEETKSVFKITTQG